MNRRRRQRNPRTVQDFVRAGILRPVQPTTASGWTRYGTGREFLPAATNLVPDPQGVLADGTFWPGDETHVNTTANVAVPLAVPEALSGLTKCISYVSDGTADDATTANLTVVASTAYRTSLYVYAPTVGGDITITAETGTSHAVATITAANSGWVRYSAATATGVGQVVLGIKVAFAGAGASTIYITGAQVVAESVVSPFFCGLTNDCAWTGTANASTSTRTESVLTYAAISGLEAAGTVACRVVPQWASTETATFKYFANAVGVGQYRLYHVSGTAYSRYYAPTSQNSGTTVAFSANTPSVFVGRWNNGSSGTSDLNVNGTTATQITFDETGASGWGAFHVGSSATPDSQAIAEVGPMLVSTSRKSDAWTTAIQADSGAAYSCITRLVRDFTAVGDWVIPLASDGTAYKRMR